jgi:UrcA family protein
MRHLLIAATAASALGAAAPALAQATVEELTVTGAWMDNGRPLTLSRVVDYSDLDLRYRRDQDILRQRVSDTARHVCDELGEARPNPTNLGRSCQDRAVADAMGQVRVAVADAMNWPPAYVAEVGAGADTAYVAPAPPPAAEAYGADTSATYTTRVVTNGPVADTPANRARYGQPLSHAGKQTTPSGD